MQEKKQNALAVHEMNFVPNTWDSKIAKWISDLLSPPMVSVFGFALIGLAFNDPALWRTLGFYFLIALIEQ